MTVLMTYYNEHDKNAAEWLRNLAAVNEINPGRVDERDIQSVTGADISGVRRAHFFAGIGGWDLALKLAGWPEHREVWTGSCPCQPFSLAGKGEGEEDERHLWPEFFRLIAECRPGTVFGEQVAGAPGIKWLDGVFADLEGEGYTCGAAVVGAHSVGAPHIRQRLYWVATLSGVAADPNLIRRGRGSDGTAGRGSGEIQAPGSRAPGRVENSDGERRGQAGLSRTWRQDTKQSGDAWRVDDPKSDGRSFQFSSNFGQTSGEVNAPTNPGDVPGGLADGEGNGLPREQAAREWGAGATYGGVWGDFRLVPCTDGKARRTGSGVFPLAYGLPRGGVGLGGTGRDSLARRASRARIGILKGSGNAIVPGLAAEFVRAFLEVERDSQ